MNTPAHQLRTWLSLAIVGLVFAPCQSSRILCVFPSPSLSHLLIHAEVAETLALNGHNVTVIATVPPTKIKAPHVNYIHIEGPMFNDAFAKEMLNKPAHVYKKFASTVSQVMTMANATMNNPKMLEFLETHKPGDFDAVVLGYFMNDFMLGLGAHFQCPIIISFMVQPIFSINTLIGNPAESAYVPTLFMGFKQPMDFWNRVKNFVSIIFEYRVFAAVMGRMQEEMYRTRSIISIVFVLCTSAVIPNESARILCCFPSPSLSHLFIHFSVAETLARDGHDVTVIATAPNPYKNLNLVEYIHLKEPMFGEEFARKMVNETSPVYVKLAHNIGLMLDRTNKSLNNPLMKKFLREHKAGDFDLVVLGYAMSDSILGLGAHFQCPIVLSFMIQSIFITNAMVGNPIETAYVPSLFVGLKQPLDFGNVGKEKSTLLQVSPK
ncbi:uncharacterized protein LOC133333153 [Musca vetustissima]|uniref:uncharacterized protein LOC133333153 n=1 Tax=Musca vetustissima TaxID=27455 RepID=UPI002AB7D8A6|nr:uncharacterized protein LOC133333153 [Musca vetustissima]